MSIRLETVEDFEKIRKAFDNPNNLDEYRIKNFGFCSFCDGITEYSAAGVLISVGVLIFCFDCEKNYISGHWRDYYKNHPNTPYIVFLPEMSDTGDKIKWLHSYARQRDFFNEALEEFIKKQKAIRREANNKVRRLAKLRIARTARY